MTARPSPVVRLSVVESTQTNAFRLAAQGAPDRTVVVADHQSAGRGRRGRSWNDAPGTSLLASILVRPRVAPALLATFSIATAVAVAEALRRATGIEARLKWPNDVLARGRKLAGILVESRILTSAGTGVSEPPRTSLRPPTVAHGTPPTLGAGLADPVPSGATGAGGTEPRRAHGTPPTLGAGLAGPVPSGATGAGGTEPRRADGTPPTLGAGLAGPVTMVIGVGVNLAQRAFPAELADRATSVAIETGRVPDRDSVLEAVLQEFDAWRWRLESQGFGQVRERWLALSESIGRRVRVDAVAGLAVGLDVDGALLVDDGRVVQRIVAGEIASEVEHAARR